MNSEIQDAIKIGEQNRDTALLVRNWCAHARIVKHGGVGLIEQQTGLPIGHHGLQCDYAAAGGSYTWDMREAALDFYDRNCVDCKSRKPVSIPNLSTLVKEREDRRAVAAQRAKAVEIQESEARDARRLARARMRDGLGPLSSAIVDHIDELDDNRDTVHRDRLSESARLAPEHFVPPIINYVFDLAEREPWFSDTGVAILAHVKADPARLTKLALLRLGKAWPVDTHIRVLLDRVSDIDRAQIPDALPSVVELAYPYHEFSLGSERSTPPQPEVLLALWREYREAVREGFDRMLSSREYNQVERAARGLIVLEGEDSTTMQSFLRTMVSKFSRAALLVDDYDELRQPFRFLREALVAAFECAPDEVDSLVQEYIAASDRQSKDRAYKIYEAVLRGRRHDTSPVSPDSRVQRVAFKRMLWAATTEDSKEILDCAGEVFRGRPYELINIARAELDGLLGALLLLDDKLQRHDETAIPKNADMLQAMERRNRRSAITGLMKSLVEWASIAAKDDPALVGRVVAMIDQIPEGRDYLKGIALGSIEHLGETVEGLKLMLPHLYYGLVGPSVVVRSFAATALGEAPDENIPPLVYEAFSMLLWDQYVMVHKSAVDAMRWFNVPEIVRNRTAQALLNLIKHYAQKSHEDRFVVECVSLLAYELRRLGSTNGKVGKFLIKVLTYVDPLYLRDKLRSIGRALAETEGFADLLIKMIPHVDDQDHRREDELTLLEEIPEAAILVRKDAFEKLGAELAPERPWLAIHIIEALARAGAWDAARKVAEAGADRPQPTMHNESRLILMNGLKIAAAFEEAIAEGRMDDLSALTKRWEENVIRQEVFKADVERRNSRSGFPSSL